MSHRHFVIRLAVIGAATGLLAACSQTGYGGGQAGAPGPMATSGPAGSMGPMGGMGGMAGMGGMMSRPAQVVTLTAALSGAQEVPPNDKSATGQAEVTFNKDTQELKYRVTYAGLSGPATGAHIHGPAAAGANGPVVVPFASPGSPISGEARLNPTQAGDLLAGLYYVNIHTAAHPGGEIRGQLRLRP